MLVPKFALTQTDEAVVVTIKLPYVRVGDAEVSVVRPTLCLQEGFPIVIHPHPPTPTHPPNPIPQQEGQDFAFYCKPYLLKLHFPHALKDSEEDESHCRAVYDANVVRTCFSG